MARISRDFQIFAKPGGAICNLDCRYCYYVSKKWLHQDDDSLRMQDDMLERYIQQHIAASSGSEIRFSWHGGEPTVLGLDYFKKITAIQKKLSPPDQRIINGIQTNGTLLTADWCSYFANEGYSVGLSLDGPEEMHDRYRTAPGGNPSHAQAMRGYDLLQRYGVNCDILCVVNVHNAHNPEEVYRFFKEIGASYVSFIPLVERERDAPNGVCSRTVSAEAWGDFLCTVFDEWRARDIGLIKVQIFEEAARIAFGQEHSLCIFRPVCGDIPVVEHNGDFYSCDHFVDEEHCLGNIGETPLDQLLESPAQKIFGRTKRDALPRYCLKCEVKGMCNGECPKNRFIQTPDGEDGLNYLCEGYRRFFNHCGEFVSEVATQWRRQTETRHKPGVQTTQKQAIHTPGRNSPCPCGSGLKYKKCCINK